MDMDLSSSNSHHHSTDPNEDVHQSAVDLINLGFNQQIDLKCNDDSKNREDDDDDDDFTFMLIGEDDAPINYDDQVFEDGKIRPVFPLFDQNLLLDGEYDIEEIDQLPIFPPVDKIFIESPRGFKTTSDHKQNDDSATGPYCTWSKSSTTATATAELNKKSNSTGFSKLWRLKEIVSRSNSDGRDAFVFLKSSDKSTAATTSSSSANAVGNADGTFVKVNVSGGKARVVKQGAKTKKPTVSAHEAYLRSREEDRRRSYLPYRPELMGLFTNVHGGLSKNVHPY